MIVRMISQGRFRRSRGGRSAACRTMAVCIAVCGVVCVGASAGDVLAAGADLSIAGITLLTPQPMPGEPIEIDVAVGISGECPGCSPVRLSYWDDSEDGNVACADGRSLEPLEEMVAADHVAGSVTLRVVLAGYPRPGWFRAWFWIDCAGVVADANQANNKAFVHIPVGAEPDCPEPDGNCVPGPVVPDEPTVPAEPTEPAVPTEPSEPSEPSDPVAMPIDPETPGLPTPSEPPVDEEVASDAPARPGFCGMPGGGSALSLSAWFAATLLGLMRLRRRAFIDSRLGVFCGPHGQRARTAEPGRAHRRARSP